MKNLGYMFFFLIYTAFEELFRKTAVVLIIFNSSFILGMYCFTFVWPLYYNEMQMDEDDNRYLWMNLYPNSNSYTDPFNMKADIKS
jgi:hypothetical protein